MHGPAFQHPKAQNRVSAESLASQEALLTGPTLIESPRSKSVRGGGLDIGHRLISPPFSHPREKLSPDIFTTSQFFGAA